MTRRKPAYPTREQLAERREWAESFNRCWICGWTNCVPSVGLEVHEIASRARAPLKWAIPQNYFRACSFCNTHVLNHLPESLQLAYKRHFDVYFYDRVLVNRLRGRADDSITEGDVRAWADFVAQITD